MTAASAFFVIPVISFAVVAIKYISPNPTLGMIDVGSNMGILWQRAFTSDTAGYDTDQNVNITTDTSGNAYAAISWWSQENIIKYTNSGTLSGSDGDSATSSPLYLRGVSASSNGDRWIVYTRCLSTCATYDFVTVRYHNVADKRLFQASGFGKDTVRAVVVDSSGNVIVAGNSSLDGTNFSLRLIKYDSEGNPLFNKTYPLISSTPTSPYAVDAALGPSGGVYVLEYIAGAGQAVIRKFDSSLNNTGWQVIQSGVSSGATDTFPSITADTSGNVYSSWIDATWSKYLTFKYNADGSPGWSKEFSGATPYYLGRPFDIAIDGNNNLYVAGWGWCSPNCDLGGTPATYNNAVIRYNASNGDRIGYFLFGDYLNNAGPRISVDSSNRLFLISPLYEKNYVVKFEINSPPSLLTFNDSPDPIVVGNAITLSATWSDPDSPEQGKVHFCKTNQIAPSSSGGSCTGTTIKSSTLTAPGSVNLSYPTQSSDLGMVTYYVFACDDGGKCSGTTGNSGMFAVIASNLIISTAPAATVAGPYTAEQSLQFKGTVRNSGTAQTTSSVTFYNRLRIDVDNNGSFDLISEPTLSNLAAGGTSDVTSSSWTAVVGTHRVELCADTSNTGANNNKINNETNESDNCNAAGTGLITVGATFNYSLSNSDNISVTQGGSGSNTITRTLGSGTTQGVTLSVSGLPSGASASFTTNPCSPTCSSTLTITTTGSTPTGTYLITVTGSPLNKTTTFNLIVSASPACNDGLDNDGDGKIDFGGANPDPGCSDTNDTDETDIVALPDLIPSRPIQIYNASTSAVITTMRAGSNFGVIFSSMMKNQGNANAVPASGNITSSFRIVNLSQGFDANNFPSLGINAERWLSSTTTPPASPRVWYNIPAGTHTIRLCVDTPTASGGKITESNESNNCTSGATDTIFIVTAPDLVVSTPVAQGTLEPDQPITFIANVQNQGNDQASNLVNSFYVDLNNDNTGSIDLGNGVYADTVLTSSPSNMTLGITEIQLATSQVWTGVSGTHRILVCADTTKITMESNENNNCMNTTFTVAVPAQSDLIISIAPSLNSGVLMAGFNTTFKATVKNIGVSATPSGFTSRFFIDLNNDGTLNIVLTPDPTKPILSNISGNNTTQIISGTWNAIAGKHRVVVCADDPSASAWGSSSSDFGDFRELDDINNCSSATAGSSDQTQGTGIITVGQFQEF